MKNLLILCFTVLSLSLFASVIDDAIKLEEAGLPVDLMVAWANRQHAYDMNKQDADRLEEAGVSKEVITILALNRSMPKQEQASKLIQQPSEAVQVIEYVAEPPVWYAPDYEYISPVSFIGTPIYITHCRRVRPFYYNPRIHRVQQSFRAVVRVNNVIRRR